jgi:hypothetical protein
VESGVASELRGLIEADARPGLTQTALALARIMDNPKAVNQQPAAAKALSMMLDMLTKRSRSRAKLALVKSMTSRDDTTGSVR